MDRLSYETVTAAIDSLDASRTAELLGCASIGTVAADDIAAKIVHEHRNDLSVRDANLYARELADRIGEAEMVVVHALHLRYDVPFNLALARELSEAVELPTFEHWLEHVAEEVV